MNYVFLHPTKIAASSLPIYDAAVERYPHLKSIQDAMHFCTALCSLAAVNEIKVREYDAIARVANGELWPNCLLIAYRQRGVDQCRVISPSYAAFILQPGGLADLLDFYNLYRVNSCGTPEPLQAELDAPNHAVKFWTAAGELVATGIYPEH